MTTSKTPTNLPFPSRAIEQEDTPQRYLPLPTPQSLKDGVLFGLPLRSSLTGQEVTDSALQNFINQAISEIEHELDLYITPVTFRESHDYSRHMNFWSFGYLRVDHSPILDVQKFQLTFNNNSIGPNAVPLVDVPLEFIYVQPNDGTVQLVPAQGTTISGFIVSIYSGLGWHAFNNQVISNWPGAILVEYRAGFETDKVPALLVGLIENLAAYKMLSILGPLLFPYNSVSIGIDGTSQGTSGPGPAFLANRLNDLEKIIQSQKEAARTQYLKRFFIDAL